MSEISYSYSKKRREFGRIVDFHPFDPDVLCECPPNQEIQEQYVRIDPYETEIQNIPTLTESQTNTERIVLKNKGQAHVEGGWPLGIDPTEFEEKMKYCKKIERDESYYTTCKQLIEGNMDGYLKQNNAIDIYGEYFTGGEGSIAEATSLSPPSMKITTTFKDPSLVKRTAAALSWMADGRKLAVAYCNLRFQGATDATSPNSYIWDIQNPNEPCETLIPSSPLCSIDYYSKDPHLVAGGSYNGVVQYWDVRQPLRPAGKSQIEESHKDPVWAVRWLQSKSGEILSVSTDGRALVWDCRLPDKPLEIKTIDTESVTLQPKTNEGGAKGVLGGLCIDYDPQIGGPAKFMIGTEQGTILSCNRKGKTQFEKISSNTYNGHHGPVYTVQRNPHHPKYFLTVGDWTARIWFEDFKMSSMYNTYYHKSHLTSGAWHPNRTGVFFTTRMDGYIDAWDILHRQSAPVVSLPVSDYAAHTLKITLEGHHIAVGAVDGTVSLIELSQSLYTPQPNEKASIGRILENESLRDKNLDKAQKEKKTLLKKQRMSQHDTDEKRLCTVDEDALNMLSNSYLEVIQKEEEETDMDRIVKKRAKMMELINDGYDIEDK
eukprot:Tbor_TRINITY_DN4997_c1_g1::TRINITY_DN4997_c1_g1_i1::g.9900::m.9900/K11143/DNAI2; dynein intermediate chain 2, axonemal